MTDQRYDEFDRRRDGRGRTQFDDSEFAGTQRSRRGLRDEDWNEEEDYDLLRRRRNRDNDDYYDDESPRRRTSRRGYDNGEYDMEKPASFRKRHPIVMNLIYIVICGIVLGWMLMWFLDYWTFHGQERVVPDLKGQSFATAQANVVGAGMRAEIADSIFDSYSRPGTVVEQTPIPNARIKKGGTVYLTIVAFSPKLVTVPDFYNVSVRQARSMFEGLGISAVREVPVPSEYEGLVLGAKFNGVELRPGARIPVSAVVTLEVGQGYQSVADDGTLIDSAAIDAVIDDLMIDELNID